MASPFEILGIEADADEETVEQAYRERIIEAHPDHGGSTREFQLVRTAYKQLKASDRSGDDAEIDIERKGKVKNGSRIEYLNYAVLDDHGLDLNDDDLFEKAADSGLDPEDYGKFLVKPHESVLEAAENRGFMWPFACRGGACANCAVIVKEGELSMPVNNILPSEMIERGIRLSCNGIPITDEMKIIYNIKHLPELEELRLPPRPFKLAHASD